MLAVRNDAGGTELCALSRIQRLSGGGDLDGAYLRILAAAGNENSAAGSTKNENAETVQHTRTPSAQGTLPLRVSARNDPGSRE